MGWNQDFCFWCVKPEAQINHSTGDIEQAVGYVSLNWSSGQRCGSITNPQVRDLKMEGQRKKRAEDWDLGHCDIVGMGQGQAGWWCSQQRWLCRDLRGGRTREAKEENLSQKTSLFNCVDHCWGVKENEDWQEKLSFCQCGHARACQGQTMETGFGELLLQRGAEK